MKEKKANGEGSVYYDAEREQWVAEIQMMPKCESLGYCPEKKSCWRKAKAQTE